MDLVQEEDVECMEEVNFFILEWLFSAIALSAKGEEKKIVNSRIKGITKKNKPISPEFIMGFGVKSDK